MLLFLDQAKSYRVIRTTVAADGTATRERLGAIPKATMAVPEELAAALTEDERREADNILSYYRSSEDLAMRYRAAQFPQTVREMVEYIADGASSVERHLLVTSLLEGIRQIRKMEREQQI